MSIVHLSRGPAHPGLGTSAQRGGHRLQARAPGPFSTRPTIPWEDFESDYDVIRDAISRVVPDFEDFNARVRKTGRVPASQSGQRIPVRHAHRARRFSRATPSTGSGCRQDISCCRPCGRMTSGTPCPTRPTTGTRGIKNGRRIVLVNPADIEALGLADRQLVDLVSTWEDGVERRRAGFFASSHIPPRGVQQPRTTRKPTCSSHWTVSPTSATHPHPRVSSCGSNRRTNAAGRQSGQMP